MKLGRLAAPHLEKGATKALTHFSGNPVFKKRYFIIDQQIARLFCTIVNVFHATKIINSFLNSRISGNQYKEF